MLRPASDLAEKLVRVLSVATEDKRKTPRLCRDKPVFASHRPCRPRRNIPHARHRLKHANASGIRNRIPPHHTRNSHPADARGLCYLSYRYAHYLSLLTDVNVHVNIVPPFSTI